jgi:serine/threonine-protein kinase RsbW
MTMDQLNLNGLYKLDLPAEVHVLPVISDTLTAILKQVEAIAEPETTIYNVVLSVHEICTNIIEHAYGQQGGRIELIIQVNNSSGQLAIDLYDTGRPFTPEDVPEPDLDDVPIRGYGLFIVYQLMDQVSYSSDPDKNHWRLEKNVLK